MIKKILYGLMISLAFISCDDAQGDRDDRPKIYFKDEGQYEISLTDTIQLKPKIIYDKKSEYCWKIDGEVVSQELNYKFAPQKMKDYNLIFEVRNGNGADTSSVFVMVREMVDFQEMDNVTVKSKAQQLIIHADSTYENFLSSKGHKFHNNYIADTLYWGGFAYSSRVDVQNLATEESLGCAFISQKMTSAQYLSVTNINGAPIAAFKEPYIVRSIDIANDNYCTVLSKFGIEGVISEFQQGDYLKVRIYGITDIATGVVTSNYVEHTLINCNFDGPAMYYRQNDWKTVDLRELGMVEGIYLELLSSAQGFPLLCCIDNIRLQKE